MATGNPLFADRETSFLLWQVHDLPSLLTLPAFRAHSPESVDMVLGAVRRFAREVLLPTWRPMDQDAPIFRDGRVSTHPLMKSLYPQLVELGLLEAVRPVEAGGQALPWTVFSLASVHLMAGNLSAYGWLGLTLGAAHLIEVFGSAALKDGFMRKMYAGQWTGTMALTEPQAGSSLADVKTRATPAPDGTYRIAGNKIFISGADNDFAENVVHMTLARIDGAPAGTKGLSLFAVPRLRPQGERLVDNDVQVAGMIHKLGWRGIPSLMLNYGERGDCHGWLVGAPHRGMPQMFQMMNEARIMVGLNGVATAAVAYQEALAYARVRLQGRSLTEKDATRPPLPIIEHPDVRRMLLRQKAVVEGGLSLLVATSRQSDLAAHGETPQVRERAQLLLDLLTPIAKTFPAERGFEANALAVQIHGGYGYASEYPVEGWLRDQKLNTLHEGTSGIQALDLLGRKVPAQGGAALGFLREEVDLTIARARGAGVDAAWGEALRSALEHVTEATAVLATAGMEGNVERMMLHAADYLDMLSVVAVAWQWLLQAAAAQEGLRRGPDVFLEGKLRAAQYWIHTELPRVALLAQLCRSGEESYARIPADGF